MHVSGGGGGGGDPSQLDVFNASHNNIIMIVTNGARLRIRKPLVRKICCRTVRFVEYKWKRDRVAGSEISAQRPLTRTATLINRYVGPTPPQPSVRSDSKETCTHVSRSRFGPLCVFYNFHTVRVPVEHVPSSWPETQLRGCWEILKRPRPIFKRPQVACQIVQITDAIKFFFATKSFYVQQFQLYAIFRKILFVNV